MLCEICHKKPETETKRKSTICDRCFRKSNLIHPKNRSCRDVDKSELPKYIYDGIPYYKNEDIQEYVAQTTTELDELHMSERYGFWGEEERRRLLKKICEKKKKCYESVTKDPAMDVFIEYGLINAETEEEFFGRY
jgi:hypothetical protein